LNIARYKARASENGATATNYANRIEGVFTSEGLQLESRIKDEKWKSRWELKGLGNHAQQKEIGKGDVRFTDSRVEIRREEIGLTEYFNNTPAGLEHGFVLNRKQNTDGTNLVLTLAIDGDLRAQAVENGQRLILFDEKDEAILSYDKLKVFDAAGTVLAAQMAIDEKGNLTFEIADATAAYPITIDPTFTRQAQITAADGGAGDLFGFSVAVSGNTAIVGASDDDIGAHIDQGSAYVFVRNGIALDAAAKTERDRRRGGRFFR
jgi:hypothetical protein